MARFEWPSFPTSENWQRYQEDQSLTFADIGVGPLLQEQINVLPEFEQIAATAIDTSMLASLNRSISNTFGVGIESALSADHTPTGPEAVVWHAMEGYLFIGGVLSGSSAGSLMRLGLDVAAQEAIGKGVELTAGYVFRGGSATTDNLTPRPAGCQRNMARR